MPDIELYGATYSDVPAVDLPKSGGGTARFYDPNEITFPVTSVNNQTGDVVLKTSDITNDSGYKTLECYVEPSAANYTIGGLNYLEMDYPLGLTGDQVVSIGLATWSNNSGPFSIFPYGTTLNKWYIVGAAGTTINGAKFKYWYIPSEGE